MNKGRGKGPCRGDNKSMTVIDFQHTFVAFCCHVLQRIFKCPIDDLLERAYKFTIKLSCFLMEQDGGNVDTFANECSRNKMAGNVFFLHANTSLILFEVQKT